MEGCGRLVAGLAEVTSLEQEAPGALLRATAMPRMIRIWSITGMARCPAPGRTLGMR